MSKDQDDPRMLMIPVLIPIHELFIIDLTIAYIIYWHYIIIMWLVIKVFIYCAFVALTCGILLGIWGVCLLGLTRNTEWRFSS